MALDSHPYRVVLIDPHHMFRLGVEHECAARAQLEVVASVGTGQAGIAAVAAAQPDAVLADVRLADVPPSAMLARLCAGGAAGPAVVVLSDDRDGAAVYRALAAGAAGYLTRDLEGAAICEALIAVARGDTVISPALHRLIATEIRLHAAGGDTKLTPREREVLGLVAEGCSTPQIARELYISHTTVKSHLANVYEKLGVSNRAAAVAQAMKRGLVDAQGAAPEPEPVPSVRLAPPPAAA